jgi:hypothetical protein
MSLVGDILRAEDIEGLIQVGAPSDEYEGEARKVTAALQGAGQAPPTEAALVSILRGVWDEMFGPFSPEELQQRDPAFRNVARRILSGLLRPTDG